MSRLRSMDYLERPAPDPNIVYSPHIYEPQSFKHQGISGIPEGATYPGVIAGKRWDRAALEEAVAPVDRGCLRPAPRAQEESSGPGVQ